MSISERVLLQLLEKPTGQPQVAGFDMSVECGVHPGAARHVFARYGVPACEKFSPSALYSIDTEGTEPYPRQSPVTSCCSFMSILSTLPYCSGKSTEVEVLPSNRLA